MNIEHKQQPVLTIAIPTYNRAKFLSVCLLQIFRQIKTINPAVLEIIVSDNNSADNTESVVQTMINAGMNIIYRKNPENIGADKNFYQCYVQATGKYVLILGDDDFFIDGTIEKIITILISDEYGVVYMNSEGCQKLDIKRECK